KGVERSIHLSLCPFPVRDIIGVDDGLASHRHDLPHHLLCGHFVGTNAGRRATKVIDDDFGPLTRQLQRMSPPQPSPCTSNDRHTIQTYFTHQCRTLPGYLCPASTPETSLENRRNNQRSLDDQ